MKAQIPSNVISIILGLVIIGSLIVFGYNSFQSLQEKQETAEFAQFKADVSGTIKKLSSELGSKKFKEFKLPYQYDEMCFLDYADSGPSKQGCIKLDGNLQNQRHLIIQDSKNGETGQTVFVFGDKVPPKTLSVPNIKLGGCEAKCFEAKDSIVSLKLLGEGDSVLIGEQS